MESARRVLEPENQSRDLTEIDLERAFNTTDLAISKSAEPNEVEFGDNFDYRLTVTNRGPNPANTVQIVDTLPAGVSLVESPASCTEASAGTVTCSVADVPAGEITEIVLTVDTSNACVNGAPIELTNQGSVSNAGPMGGSDPNPGDNQALHAFMVVDTTPPELEIAVSQTTLWPPDHELHEIAVTLAATDACDDDPTIRLVSAVSSEPDNGSGDGNTTDDIQGADIGTEDTSLLLRAERSGSGSGRIYTLTFEAEDGSGNVTSVSRTVTAPKSNEL